MAVQPRRTSGGGWFFGVALLVLGIVATLGILIATGNLDVPFLRSKEVRPGPPPGMVPVLLSVKPIPAYSRVTRDHLFDSKGQPKIFYLSPEDIAKKGILTDFGKIIGRVVAEDHRAGYAFREKDFLPEGSRPGIAGGTPSGKRALVLEATEIQGVHALKAGDRIDLLASFPLEKQQPGRNRGVVEVGMIDPSQRTKQAHVEILVHNGFVVQGVSIRKEPTTSRSLTQGTRTQMKPVEEFTLAMEPEELPRITQALALGAKLIAALRSGRPGEEESEASPLQSPREKTTVIETIKGGTREIVTFHRQTAR